MTTEQKQRLTTTTNGLASLLHKSKNGLPYIPITEVANRDTIRATAKRKRETHMIDFKLLKIRDGFNLRKEYIGITELADSMEVNGLTDPLVVDMLPDGTCYIEQGHRRYKALQILKERKLLKSLTLPGMEDGTIECFINDRQVDELTRIKRQFTSNSGEKYTTLELGELCNRLVKYFNMTQVEVATELGMSRQNVKNMMIINDEPDDIKQAIKSKHITPTAAIELSRTIKDSSKRRDIIQEAVASGKAVTNSDVKKIKGEKKLEELPQSNTFRNDPELGASVREVVKSEDANISISKLPEKLVKLSKFQDDHNSQYDEARDEIAWCNNVIKNVDVIYLVVGKLNGQPKRDIENLVYSIQHDMKNIRTYIHKNKKQ